MVKNVAVLEIAGELTMNCRNKIGFLSLSICWILTATSYADGGIEPSSCHFVDDLGGKRVASSLARSLTQIETCSYSSQVDASFGFTNITFSGGACTYRRIRLSLEEGEYGMWRSTYNGGVNVEAYFYVPEGGDDCPRVKDNKYIRYASGVSNALLVSLSKKFGDDLSLSRVLSLAGPLKRFDSLYEELASDQSKGVVFSAETVGYIPPGMGSGNFCDECLVIHYRSLSPFYRGIYVMLSWKKDDHLGYIGVGELNL